FPLTAFLVLLFGPDFIRSMAPGPFLDTFIWIIVIPLTLAALTQALALRRQHASTIGAAGAALMVPLITATLGVVAAAHIASVGHQLGDLKLAVAVYILFAGIMVPVSSWIGRAAALDDDKRRSLGFSGVTRN